MKAFKSAAWLALLAGCIPAVTDAPMTGQLTAVLTSGPDPNTVVVEYRNGTGKEVRVSEQVLVTNCLALEVLDDTGRLVSVPPSTPWERDDGVAIPAGGVREQRYKLDQFSPPLQPGQYQVRVRIEGWECKPLTLRVVAER
jgi:hypothetical protein